VAQRADTTIDAVDPAARNHLRPEQSRGWPLAGGAGDAGVTDLYTLTGSGTLVTATSSGVRYACVQGTA
ncbi:hypothetical protein, partial [Marinitenerispora sediminis]|uniref:hypothetical protein n=1 Tax=Marinitenerispora sediminis TaxID=1931232 RepID=UPI000E034755